MTNPKIETDLSVILNKLDSKIDNLDNKLDRKIDNLENKLDGKIERIAEENRKSLAAFNQKIDDTLVKKIQLVERDLTWIKWLFGLFFTLIGLLLGTILTVLFKLVGT